MYNHPSTLAAAAAAVLLLVLSLASAQTSYQLELRVDNAGRAPGVKSCVVPGRAGMVIIPTQSGLVEAYFPDSAGLSHTVLDLSARVSPLARTSHTGVLSSAIHKDIYTGQMWLFVGWTERPPANSSYNNYLTLSRFDLDPLRIVANASTEVTFAQWPMYFDQRPGGGVAISDEQGHGHAEPRQFLFFGVGVDWYPGGPTPPVNFSASLDSDYGWIHRFGLNAPEGQNYVIPPSNPYAGSTRFSGVWANPLYFTVDAVNGEVAGGDIQTYPDSLNGHWQTVRIASLGSETDYPDVVGPSVVLTPGFNLTDDYAPPIACYNERGAVAADGSTLLTGTGVNGSALIWLGKPHGTNVGWAIDAGLGYVGPSQTNVLYGIRFLNVLFPDPVTNPGGFGSLVRLTVVNEGVLANHIGTGGFRAPNGNWYVLTFLQAGRNSRMRIWELVPLGV